MLLQILIIRVIAINSCLGKLFCHVLNSRISYYLENKNFFAREQAGFRKYFRTTDQIFFVKTIVDKYIHKRGKESKLFACFIDLKKTFDTVWHKGLLLKLQKAGINGNVYELLKSMYDGSCLQVRCKNLLTDFISVTQGVHQGNVLSLYYSIFL